jgi:HAD superfamily hydrolase (TIGR01662 family)
MFALKVKAVLFDLGNTLVKSWVPEMTFRKVLDSLGISMPVDEIKKALAKTDEEFATLNYNSLYGKVSYRKFWNKWDSLVLKHLGLPKDEKLVRNIQKRWFDYAGCEIYSDVKETLRKLKHMGLKIGLVSGGYEEDVHAILETITLRKELFDVIIGANTIKKVKPHPDVFKYALRKLKVKPDETLFIGDAIDDDYKGAEKVGIKAILIQRTEKYTNKTSRLRTITSLKEIFKYMG